MNTTRIVMKKVSSFLNIIGAVILVICTVVIFFNVVFRYCFNSPFRWGDEFSILMLGWFVFLPQASLELKNQQLQMTVLYNAVNQRVRTVFNALRSSITAILGLYLSYWCYKVILLNYQIGGTTMAMRLPLWITYLVVPICMLMIALIRIFDFFVKGEVDQNVDSDNTVR